MKKIVFFVLLLLTQEFCFSEEIKLIKIIENKREEGFLFIRKNSEVTESEFDITGNGVKISENGELYFIQSDMHILYKSVEEYKLIKIKYIDFLETGSEGIQEIKDKYLLCNGVLGRFKLLDKNFNPIFRIKLLDWGKRIETREAYYDEKSNILFFRDDEGQIYSIVNPGLIDEENKKNFLEPDQTIEMINSEKYFTKEHISLYKEKYLNVDGKIIWWVRDSIGNYTYQNIDNTKVKLWNGNSFYIDCTSPEEQVESISFHPSGDIYVLRMNWNTNTHNLYCIENTWDSEWREMWYKEHPNAK